MTFTEPFTVAWESPTSSALLWRFTEPPTVTEPATIGPLRLAAGIAPYLAGVSTPVRNHTLTTRIDHKFSDLHNGSVLYHFRMVNGKAAMAQMTASIFLSST